ncbi:MAG: carbohydrate deacetylase [Beduini sp.]|uniref:carbohydrate deacetylase n=1 Tax=Beduini sp. TaxID=1922300 RepID=UPI0039A0844A
MTRLIVNGDDFGMCEGVTLGILKAHRDGILRSTTMMTGMPFAAQAAQMAKDYPNLGVGLHFNLTAGRPVCDPKEIPSLVEADGSFHSNSWHEKNKKNPQDMVNYEEVYKEYSAQLQRFIELTGHMPDHFDSHHGSSDYPLLHAQLQKLIDQYDVPTRCSFDYIDCNYERPAYFSTFYDKLAAVEYFTEDQDHLLEKDLVETMCHPAFVDDFLYTTSSYNVQRTKELSVLCDPRVLEWIKINHVELINFQDLKKIK